MKAKIGGIPFDETTKVELKNTPKPTLVTSTMKALVYNAQEKLN